MNIEQDQVRREGAGEAETSGTIRGNGDAIAVELKLELIEISNVWMIFDHQDAGLRRHVLPQGEQA
jgi:hypothetical protein